MPGDSRSRFFTGRRAPVLICLLLAVSVLTAYWPVRRHDFVSFDDDRYVADNRALHDGLTLESVRWAFTSVRASNWHPVTWLSHLLDVQLFGLDPGRHHLVNVLLHLLNALLLFLVLRRMTGGSWRSGFVAALFALHPLHVESVAWIAERKDVLSAFFGLLATGAYLRYVERPGPGRYALVALLFGLGLMAKPMLVTLPFVLLLLDYWPLGRLRHAGAAADAPPHRRPRASRPVLEKAPLLVLSAASSIVTLLAQHRGGAVAPAEAWPLAVRIGNALVSGVLYLAKTLWPSGLAVYYPHPGARPLWQAVVAGGVLMAIFALALRRHRSSPFLIVGWLWYLGTLAPVIGLVQVGMQAMADRYTYLPLVGVFIAVAWGVPEWAGRLRRGRAALPVLACAVLAILMVATRLQLRHWQDSVSLFERAVAVTRENFVMRNNLANALAEAGRSDEAVRHLSEALRIAPRSADLHFNLGSLLRELGRPNEAADHYRRALAIRPDFSDAMNNLALLHESRGEYETARLLYLRAIALRPDDYTAYYNLACSFARRNEAEESVAWLRKAVDRGFHDWKLLAEDEDLESIRGTSYFKELAGRAGPRK